MSHSQQQYIEVKMLLIPKKLMLDIKDVFYRYENEQKDALQQISLSIPQGKKIALLGKSGAGKSTFIQLLLGALSPSAGTIELNGYQPESYGENIFEMISVLNQKPYLFATSVKNNIRLRESRSFR